jgi:ubiquinone/menaquinone biosynthesis C-methylase UbiE
MPEFHANIRAYYEQGGKVDRLNGGFPAGPLEFERTKEIITRYLAKPPLDVLDVGGGTGVYASWLADRGDQARLVDPVPFHVEYARSADPRIRANVGDARELSQTEESADIVLLLGPLYHLTESSDRLRALAEARRVLKPGGFLFAAGISRYAAMFDLLVRLGRLHEPHIFQAVRDVVDTGVFRGDVSNLFTTA